MLEIGQTREKYAHTCKVKSKKWNETNIKAKNQPTNPKLRTQKNGYNRMNWMMNEKEKRETK